MKGTRARRGRLVWSLGLLLVVSTSTGCGPDHPRDCVAGERGCACSPLGACDTGLACHSQRCVETHEATLLVDAPAARSCELLVHEDRATIADVTFSSGVRGAHVRRGDRASIVFLSDGDRDLRGDGVTLRWLGNEAVADFTVEESECFDRSGHSIVGARVSIR